MPSKKGKAKPKKSLATKLREARLNLHIQTEEAEKWRLESLERGGERDALRRSQKELEAKVRRLDEKIDDLLVNKDSHIAALADALDSESDLLDTIGDRNARIDDLVDGFDHLQSLHMREQNAHATTRAALEEAFRQMDHLLAYLRKKATPEEPKKAEG